MTTNGHEVAAQLVHASPGRIRLRVRRAAAAGDALERVEQALAGVAGVREVRTNPLTRSLLVSYDDRATEPEQMLAAVERVGVTVDPAAGAVAHGDADKGRTALDRTNLSQVITDVFGAADQRIADLTGGSADLRTLVPISFAVLAVRQVVAGQVTAVPWYALAWYAFDSFIKLRRTDTSTEPIQD